MKCIEDEIPFELPEGWEWCRLKDFSSLITKGTTPKNKHSAYHSNDVNYLRVENIGNNGFINHNGIAHIDTNTHLVELKRSILYDNDLLITIAGTLGKTAIVRSIDLPMNTNQAISIVRFVNLRYININYVRLIIESSVIRDILLSKTKVTSIPNLTLEIIANCIIPLPPFSEQTCIVTRITELLSYVDAIESDNSTLLTTIDQVKAKILDLAIRGKLVPQDPSDEPASALLDRIRAEKEELIKQGKIKRDKKESVIFKGEDNSYYEKIDNTVTCIDDELPFELPEGWEWVRLSSACMVNPKNALNDDLSVSFVPMALIHDGYDDLYEAEERKWGKIKKGFTHFADSDVAFAKISPCFENRKSVVFRGLLNGYGAGTTELHILRPYSHTILSEYLLYLVKSNSFINSGKHTFSGVVGQQRISKEFLVNYLLPIPPINEQKRISDKCLKLLEVLNSIEKSLS